MAGRIPEEFIDELLQRTDIVAVVGERVALRRAGANYKALCPFHDERTPSFHVSPERQTYHCFGCGAHGSAIRFLMEHDQLEFREAVTELANRIGLALPAQSGPSTAADEFAPLYRVLADADRYYRSALRDHPARRAAVDYLQQRGIDGETAAAFGIGFAPPGWDNLLKRLDDYRPAVRAGLIVERDGKRYDRFRDRITFPIHDRRGHVVAFGARVVADGEPKYLNSPESPLFQKGREIYGLYHALQAERRPERLIVVEGYMDVIALTQAGVSGAVATLGTATTREQAATLLRSSPQVVLCFDGDEAGRKAAYRAAENLLPALHGDHEVRVLLLPEGEDPDQLVRKEGHDAFEHRLTTAQPVLDLLLDQLRSGCDLTTIDGRARLLQRASGTLQRLPRGVLRETLIGHLAELSRTDAERIDHLLQAKNTPSSPSPQSPGATPQRQRPTPARNAPQTAPNGPVRHALTLLIDQPALAASAGEPDRFADRHAIAGLDLLQRLLEIARTDPQISSARLIERCRGSEDAEQLEYLAQTATPDAPRGEPHQVFCDALERIEEEIVADEHKRLIEQLEAHGGAGTNDLEARLRDAQRLLLLMDRLKRGGLRADEWEEMGPLRRRFRL